jgi:hypothetical protein
MLTDRLENVELLVPSDGMVIKSCMVRAAHAESIYRPGMPPPLVHVCHEPPLILDCTVTAQYELSAVQLIVELWTPPPAGRVMVGMVLVPVFVWFGLDES